MQIKLTNLFLFINNIFMKIKLLLLLFFVINSYLLFSNQSYIYHHKNNNFIIENKNTITIFSFTFNIFNTSDNNNFRSPIYNFGFDFIENIFITSVVIISIMIAFLILSAISFSVGIPLLILGAYYNFYDNLSFSDYEKNNYLTMFISGLVLSIVGVVIFTPLLILLIILVNSDKVKDKEKKNLSLLFVPFDKSFYISGIFSL